MIHLEEERKIYMRTIQFLDESTDDYLYLYDLINKKLYFTDKICEKYSIPSGMEGIPIESWIRIVYPKDQKKLEESLNDIQIGCSENHDMEYRLMNWEGKKVWIYCRGTVLKDRTDLPVFLMGSISEQAMRHKIDALTGFWNFEKFSEDMRKSLKEKNGYFMSLGIDNFRDINVKNGRSFGNRLLKKIADLLENYADEDMILYRLDGDQFAVDFVEKTEKDVRAFYQRVKEELTSFCTLSAGVVAYTRGDNLERGNIYQYADNALERAKREGKNKMLFFSEKTYQKRLDKIELQDELREAVMKNYQGFYLCYQPQISGSRFEIYGAEALLRFESPSRGIVSPAEFIPLLEQSRLICQVGEWAFREAARQCVKWRKKKPDFHINVNISYVQLRQDDIALKAIEILRDTGLPGSALTLEVTESMQLQDYSYFNKIFYEWKRHGIKIAIDDFGTGYSSLSYLKSIDIDEIKIDRCFVSRIQYNAYNYRLLSNMIELAHNAQIQVCCEGVETEEELAALQELRTDILQGFLFAKPYRAEEIEKIYFEEESEEYQFRIKKEDKFRQLNSKESTAMLQELCKDEIVNIVESMDEIIYVSDMDTRELYYINAAGRKMTGIYNYKGQKCYKVLQGRDKPCEDCLCRKLDRKGFQVWERNSEFLKQHFIVKGKLIPWFGKMARLEIAAVKEE